MKWVIAILFTFLVVFATWRLIMHNLELRLYGDILEISVFGLTDLYSVDAIEIVDEE